jgi:CheY-like chemotaxis protein
MWHHFHHQRVEPELFAQGVTMRTKILIVEDEWLIAYGLSVSLEAEGYTITGIADSGKRALEMVETQRPDLVLLDVNLQGEMDGIDIAAILKHRFILPYIFMTAAVDSGTMFRIAQSRPLACLRKPFSPAQLCSLIQHSFVQQQQLLPM